MPRTRPPYSEAFKARMVELVRAKRFPAELAEECGPSLKSIQQLERKVALDEKKREDGLTTKEKEALRALRKEVKRLEMEREILSKAAPRFARETELIPEKRSDS